MSADTLTADGPPVTLAPPSPAGDGPFAPTGFAVMSGASDEIAVAWIDSGRNVDLSGYSLNGTLLFQDAIAQPQIYLSYSSPSLASVPGAGVVVSWQNDGYTGHFHPNAFSNGFAVVSPGGMVFGERFATAQPSGSGQPAQAYSTVDGFALEWMNKGITPEQGQTLYGNPGISEPAFSEFQRWDAFGSTKSQDVIGPSLFPYADISVAGQEFTIQDNQAQLAGQAAVTLPGEPAHAATDVAAVALDDGHTAAVGFVDSGTDYVSLYDSTTNSFGSRIGLDWGGASDMHLVGLPDGGFAVSWMNGGAYKGELFDAVGKGGGILSLTGQFAAIDSHGDLYTVGADSIGNEVVQTYAVNGAGGVPLGQIFTSDNAGDHWTGTAGNDVFNLGRGGDVVTGNGGNDTYKFAEVPWAGGHITDFNAGDVLDLTGLDPTTGDTGSDGFADGYLKITDDGHGDAQVWASFSSDGANPWLVTTLDGVSASSLTHQGDVITVGSGGGGTPGQTFTSDNAGDHWVGTAGDDTFHIGRGGDVVTGAGGADTFAFAETPWAGAEITDFGHAQGDRIDVSGLLQASGYHGSDAMADGYLKLTDSSAGAQLWSDLNQPGNDGWWLVATLDGVSSSSLHYSGGMLT